MRGETAAVFQDPTEEEEDDDALFEVSYLSGMQMKIKYACVVWRLCA